VFPWGQPTDIAAIPAVAESVAVQLEHARAIGESEGVCIYWHNAESNVLVPLLLSEVLREVQLPVLHEGQGIVGSSFHENKAIYVDCDYDRSEYAHPHAVDIGAKSAFAIPLRGERAVLGVLAGGWRSAHAIDAATREQLETIAQNIVQSFGAIGALYVEAQVNRAEYTLVSSLIRDYASDADFEATCARISGVAKTLLGGDYAVISRHEPNLSHTYHGAQSTRSDLWRGGMKSSTPRTLEADERLDAGEIVIMGGEELSAAGAGFEHSLAEGAKTVMLAPISISGHRIGILIVGWRLEVTISMRLRHLAQTLAGHAAIAIAESQRARVFSGDAVATRRLDDSIAKQLNSALQRGDIQLEYQPIFDAKTGKIVTLEALSRWPGAPSGYERPDQFVLFAEDRGIIGALTDYVIERAAREWPHIRHLDATLTVNVSMRNFEEHDFAKRTLAKLRKHAIAAHCLGIELTETSRMIDRKSAVATARKLEGAGVTLSIDDFGEGYAALSYLKTFRAQSLKIDRRYVTNVAKDTYDYSIVRSVIDLAHSLGVAVVAEGIESTEALDVIKALGCDMVQGYALARPMPIDQVRATFS
jgi:EAL domain-containing protein (putative c-di-GMP-specific phosphodiesterase class I)